MAENFADTGVAPEEFNSEDSYALFEALLQSDSKILFVDQKMLACGLKSADWVDQHLLSSGVIKSDQWVQGLNVDIEPTEFFPRSIIAGREWVQDLHVDFQPTEVFPRSIITSRDWMPDDVAKHLDASIAFMTNDIKAPIQAAKASNPCHQGSRRNTDWEDLYQQGLPGREHKVPVRAAIQVNVDAPDGLENSAGKKHVPSKLSASNDRKRKRKPEPEVKVFVQPSDDDVLLGRGGRSNNHPGNKRYLQAKTEMQERYRAASKEEKTGISQELVDKVQKWGGRFLELDEYKRWYVVHNTVARKKCSQTLRETNTPEARAKKRAKYSQK